MLRNTSNEMIYKSASPIYNSIMDSSLQSILKTIDNLRDRYGDDILEYDVYLEQCDEADKSYKRSKLGQNWDILNKKEFNDNWEYFKCLGSVGISPEDKAIFISVNF